MSPIQILVLLAGIMAIAWVNWYFFLAGRAAAEATTGAGGMQEAVIVVEGGYSPAVVKVKRDQPVRLIFDRRETSSCSDEIVIPDFGIRRFLPAHERTAVELPASGPGEHELTCGMSMLHGRLVIE
jgi:plastocyanin domain-containing protein